MHFLLIFSKKLRPLCIWIVPGRSALLIRILASYLGKILSNSPSSSGIFLSIQQRSNYLFITLLVHFISHQESGRVFNRLSNRTHRQFVALTTVSLILNISNPSTFCPILNNSEHNTVTFSPLSGSWNGWPLAPRSTSSRRPSARHPQGQHANGGGGGQGTQAACAMDPAAVSARRRQARGLDQALRRPRGCTAPLSPWDGDASAGRPRWRGRRWRRRRGRRLPRAPSAVSFTAGWGREGCAAAAG